MTLYFHLIKLGVHIGHSKIDWNPQLNIYLAGKTNSNYLIFNVNKFTFFLPRTTPFYRLLGLNHGSSVINYFKNFNNNNADLLEGSLVTKIMIPHSYPFIYSLIKPKGFIKATKIHHKTIFNKLPYLINFSQLVSY